MGPKTSGFSIDFKGDMKSWAMPTMKNPEYKEIFPWSFKFQELFPLMWIDLFLHLTQFAEILPIVLRTPSVLS